LILGILIFLVGMATITIIIEHFPMTPANAILVWDHDALAFRETGQFFGENTVVSVPPPYIQYGDASLKISSYDYFCGRLNLIYLSEEYNAEEWYKVRGTQMATAAERIEIGDSVKIHNGIATAVRPGPIEEYEPVESTPYKGSTYEETEEQNH